MIGTSLRRTQWWLPTLGLVCLIVLTLLLAGSIAIYRKAMPWQRADAVSVVAESAGLELRAHSDVKLQGRRVGEVTTITSDGRAATIVLAIDPDEIGSIPADVEVHIVPKTLFGEKYVDLRMPAEPSPESLEAGDVLQQATTSVEIGRIFDELNPLLAAADPVALSGVLRSVADALRGRGRQLGEVIARLQRFLVQTRPALRQFVADIDLLTEVTDTYARATPDLLRAVDSASRLSRDVLIAHEDDLETFLDEGTGAARLARQLLEESGRPLAHVLERSAPVTALLAEYSPALGCFLEALHRGEILGNQAIGARGPFTNLSNDMVVDRDPYSFPDDLPSNPRSDANLANLPSSVPNWAPHCARFASYVLELQDVAPYEQMLEGYPPVRREEDQYESRVTTQEMELALDEVRRVLRLIPDWARELLGVGGADR